MNALILIADGFDDLELFYPWFRLREEGVNVTLASPKGQTACGLHGYRVEADQPLSEVNPSAHDLLIIPGGQSPERLRLREEAVDIARTFMDEDRTVIAICHGPQLLISASILGGRHATCAPAIRDDLRVAGAHYRDEAVVVDNNLVTSRGTDDLPELCQQLMAFLKVRT